MKKKLGFLQKCQQKQMVSRNWKKTRNLGGVKRSIKAVPRGPPIWIWILDSPPIWGVKFVEKLGFPNIFGSEKKTY